jgi:hypothetical protein
MGRPALWLEPYQKARTSSEESVHMAGWVVVSSIKTDPVVREFSKRADRNAPDEAQLKQGRREFKDQLLRDLSCFDRSTSPAANGISIC